MTQGVLASMGLLLVLSVIEIAWCVLDAQERNWQVGSSGRRGVYGHGG